MGFWSVLGKIGAGVAAPFTGGASLAAIPVINALEDSGQTANAIEQGRTQGRLAQNQVNSGYDQNRLRAAQLLNDAILAQNNFALSAPGKELGNSVQGDIAANVQPVSINGPVVHTHGQIPQITGGLSPSLLSSNTRQLGANVSRDMLLRNMHGADNLNLAGNVPTITPPPSANGLDSTLNGIALGGGLTGSILDFVNKFRRPGYQVPDYGMSGGSGDPNFDNGVG